ncbi:hypothetical protein TNCV_3399961 [Trichonephila clavipes]|nr:hypothetical protein TNCV_3399961 [Trichonephila clavipes]
MTGEYLTKAILGKLEKYGLDIQNCRGQGYNNGANMVGSQKYSKRASTETFKSYTVLQVGESSDFRPYELYEESTKYDPKFTQHHYIRETSVPKCHRERFERNFPKYLYCLSNFVYNTFKYRFY